MSKAALERLIDVFRTEHPGIGFTRVIVGDCAGGEGPSMTEFANGWDPGLAVEVGAIWANRNLLEGSLYRSRNWSMPSTPCCGATPGTSIPSITVAPRHRA